MGSYFLRRTTPSVFHQRHIGRVLRSSCNISGRRTASSCGREPRPGRCPPLWPGDLRNDGGSVSAAGYSFANGPNYRPGLEYLKLLVLSPDLWILKHGWVGVRFVHGPQLQLFRHVGIALSLPSQYIEHVRQRVPSCSRGAIA